MPTMILFALIVTTFTLIQFLLDYFQDRSSDYLVLVNTITFGVVIIGTVAFGFPHPPGFDLSRYTVGHVIASAALIAGTLVLYGLATYLRGRPKYYFPAALTGIAVVVVAALYIALPDVYNLLIASLFAFFGEQPVTTTVQEARAWSFDMAWAAFNWGLLLMAGGIAALLWRSREKVNPPAHVFVLVWTLIILASTMAHVRYEYYLAVNVALLSAVFAGAVLNIGWKDVTRFAGTATSAAHTGPAAAGKREEPPRKRKKGGKAPPEARKPKASSKDQPDYLKAGAVIAVVVVTLLFAGSSLQANIALANNARYGGVDSQWMEALKWMGTNTPDPVSTTTPSSTRRPSPTPPRSPTASCPGGTTATGSPSSQNESRTTIPSSTELRGRTDRPGTSSRPMKPPQTGSSTTSAPATSSPISSSPPGSSMLR
ncbi:hypothetical protein [Methanoculleus chikugoensis]|uniref:hypothetical protein n=1 Tax=Methanoculleus chikugoensis TaxID=118126 RepID=UPI000AD503D0|nr:hypothetical protein [Methanoculleus chikugoensis]